MSQNINVQQIIEKDLKGSTFICGFPGVGLVGNIVANFLINNLKLEQIGIIDGPGFPSISVVKEGVPNHPMRLYSGEQICNNGNCIIKNTTTQKIIKAHDKIIKGCG